MKFGKKLLALTVVSVMSLSLISCGEKKDQSVLDKDKLILGFDDTFVPMGFKDSNGEYVGFDIDLAKAISEKLNKEIRASTYRLEYERNRT